MMSTPAEWPAFPLLPVKRHVGGELQVGTMIAHDGARVFLSNVHLPLTATAERIEYTSLDALLDDGWVVD